jgi:hypothetical protein
VEFTEYSLPPLHTVQIGIPVTVGIKQQGDRYPQSLYLFQILSFIACNEPTLHRLYIQDNPLIFGTADIKCLPARLCFTKPIAPRYRGPCVDSI